MSSRPKGPKQQEQPNLPKAPEMPYGEGIDGSKKVKQRNHSRQKRNPHHDM
jgi:small acid-soluble spore protein P (minor)